MLSVYLQLREEHLHKRTTNRQPFRSDVEKIQIKRLNEYHFEKWFRVTVKWLH